MFANLALSADLLKSSEDILAEKLDGKKNFFLECWSIKIIVFMEQRVATLLKDETPFN